MMTFCYPSSYSTFTYPYIASSTDIAQCGGISLKIFSNNNGINY